MSTENIPQNETKPSETAQAQASKNAPKRRTEVNRQEKIDRKNRIPLHKPQATQAPKREGYYVYGFVAENEESKAITDALAAGYRFMEEEVKSRDGRPKQMGKRSCKPVGGGLNCYWMQIPLELKEDDWADQRSERARILNEINTGQIIGKAAKAEGESSSTQKDLLGQTHGKVSFTKESVNNPS